MASYYGDRARDVPSWDSFETGEDDEAVDISEYQYASRDHLLFCIDASKSMHQPRSSRENDNGETVKGKSALHQVLESVVKFEKGKVITGPADSVGLMLFNVDATKVKDTSGNYKPGTLVYQNLQMINAEEIKKIIKLVEAVQEQYDDMDDDSTPIEPEILAETFPPAKDGDMLNIADVLATCNFMFRDAGTKLAGNKRIFLVTDNDAPPGSESNIAPAQTVYGDLLTYGITVNTYFIDRPEHRFDPRGYWNEILNREEEEGAPTADKEDDGLDALADIMDDLIIRQAPKRRQFSLPLKMGGEDGEIEIGVSGYSMISEQGKGTPKMVYMRGQTIEEVVVKTEYHTELNDMVIRPEEIVPAYKFGHAEKIENVLEPNWWETEGKKGGASTSPKRDVDDEDDEDMEISEQTGQPVASGSGNKGSDTKRVVARTRLQFTPDEVKEFKTLGVPTQIKILGFQSGRNLKFDENIKHAYFIYPDEDAYTGSTRTFAALHKSLLKLKKHALALARFRTNTTPEIAILIPQEEKFTKDGAQDQAPGFHVICMPFADDMRKPPKIMSDNLVATDEQSELMATIIRRLRFKAERYRSEAYPNPALAFHYAQLQSLAFEEDFDPAEADELDKTLPKHAGMHKTAGEYMKAWNQSIADDDRAVEKLTKTKRAVVEVTEADLADIEGQWKKGKLDKLKVAELKDYIKFKGIPTEGKTLKADLVLLLDSWLKKGGAGNKKTKA